MPGLRTEKRKSLGTMNLFRTSSDNPNLQSVKAETSSDKPNLHSVKAEQPLQQKPRNLYGTYAELVEQARGVSFKKAPAFSNNSNVVRFEGNDFQVIFCAKDKRGKPCVFCPNHPTPNNDFLENDGDWCHHVYAVFLKFQDWSKDIRQFVCRILEDARFRNVPLWLVRNKLLRLDVDTCLVCFDPLPEDIYSCQVCGYCLDRNCYTTIQGQDQLCPYCRLLDTYKPEKRSVSFASAANTAVKRLQDDSFDAPVSKRPSCESCGGTCHCTWNRANSVVQRLFAKLPSEVLFRLSDSEPAEFKMAMVLEIVSERLYAAYTAAAHQLSAPCHNLGFHSRDTGRCVQFTIGEREDKPVLFDLRIRQAEEKEKVSIEMSNSGGVVGECLVSAADSGEAVTARLTKLLKQCFMVLDAAMQAACPKQS